ncbi:MAG TPA: hypothetical protein VFH39_04690 [Candidatus Saccharimonadales bacterium]|nr:hypothetical protein [Candidatus Saccharimonadales bacterium]
MPRGAQNAREHNVDEFRHCIDAVIGQVPPLPEAEQVGIAPMRRQEDATYISADRREGTPVVINRLESAHKWALLTRTSFTMYTGSLAIVSYLERPRDLDRIWLIDDYRGAARIRTIKRLKTEPELQMAASLALSPVGFKRLWTELGALTQSESDFVYDKFRQPGDETAALQEFSALEPELGDNGW